MLRRGAVGPESGKFVVCCSCESETDNQRVTLMAMVQRGTRVRQAWAVLYLNAVGSHPHRLISRVTGCLVVIAEVPCCHCVPDINVLTPRPERHYGLDVH